MTEGWPNDPRMKKTKEYRSGQWNYDTDTRSFDSRLSFQTRAGRFK
jgi:hypothetical protein